MFLRETARRVRELQSDIDDIYVRMNKAEQKKQPDKSTEEKVDETIRNICDWIDKRLDSSCSGDKTTMEMINALARLVDAKRAGAVRREGSRYVW